MALSSPTRHGSRHRRVGVCCIGSLVLLTLGIGGAWVDNLTALGPVPITVEKSLQKLPEIIEAKIDFDKKTATVKFDADKVTPQALAKATTDAGYPSTVRK